MAPLKECWGLELYWSTAAVHVERMRHGSKDRCFSRHFFQNFVSV